MFRREDERLEAEVERDLQAIDGALAGLDLHPDFDELARLAVAIRDEGPSIDDEFAAMLDERAAKGFPRAERTSPASAIVRRLGEWLGSMRMRRLLPVAGAAASLLIVTGVAISVLRSNGGEGGQASSSQVSTTSASSEDQVASRALKAGSSAAGSGTAAPTTGQFARAAAPSLNEALSARAKSSEFALDGRHQVQGFGAINAAAAAPPGRHVSQTANLTLSTDPDKVRNIASSVTAIVNSYHGLVISSRITSGNGSPGGQPGPVPLGAPEPLPFSAGALGADFQLRIPATQVDSALNDLSGLGLVVSRTQGTQDITGRFASAHDRIKSLTSERDQLIKQLSAPFITQDAIDAINARLRAVRAQLENAQGELNHLKQRVAMVPVHVSVVAKGSGGGDDGFDLGDAAHDAGRVLVVGAGVALVSLAVIVPLALIAALVWLATSAVRRRRREQALD
jgi:hypothetical protein